MDPQNILVYGQYFSSCIKFPVNLPENLEFFYVCVYVSLNLTIHITIDVYVYLIALHTLTNKNECAQKCELNLSELIRWVAHYYAFEY